MKNNNIYTLCIRTTQRVRTKTYISESNQVTQFRWYRAYIRISQYKCKIIPETQLHITQTYKVFIYTNKPSIIYYSWWQQHILKYEQPQSTQTTIPYTLYTIITKHIYYVYVPLKELEPKLIKARATKLPNSDGMVPI